MKTLLQKYKMKMTLAGERKLKSAWNNPKAQKVLSPIANVYGKIAEMKAKIVTPYATDIPVICVGNLTMGGVGKTPLAMWLAEYIKKVGKKPVFLTRGYKGREKDIFIADYDAQDEGLSQRIGDEPAMLLKVAPVVVDADRARGAETAEKNGADIIIMDDGFQNHGLRKNKSILVFDGKIGIGNGKIFPAGPLREGFVSGLKRAKAAVIVGDDTAGIESKIKENSPVIEIFKAKLIPDEGVAKKLYGQKVLAFTGIGNPDKFFDTLKSLGADVVKNVIFPDHYLYTDEDMADLENMAKDPLLTIVTTTKDAIKLNGNFAKKVLVLPVKISFDDEKRFTDFIGLA